MTYSFKRGVVRVSADKEPDWTDVSTRLAFARDLNGIPAHFLPARHEGGGWIVPYLSAESEEHPDAADIILEKYTPYEVPEAERVDVLTASADELKALLRLARGEVAEVGPKSVTPESQRPASAPTQATDPKSVFEGLVGMSEQKEILIKLSTALAKHGRSAVECFHFVFVGNPGTGKTELANRLVSYLDSLGVTDGTHKMVKVSGSELMADYVGRTGNKVRRIVNSATGGLLFIDEFYGLSVKEAGGYGHEAIDALTERLDTLQDKLVCVVAGYPKEVDQTLDLNPGLRDRFGYRVEFPDYSPNELAEILRSIARRRGFTVACNDDVLAKVLDDLRASKDFSNARSVRRLVDHAAVEASCDHDEPIITERDLLVALPQCLTKSKVRRAGF